MKKNKYSLLKKENRDLNNTNALLRQKIQELEAAFGGIQMAISMFDAGFFSKNIANSAEAFIGYICSQNEI